LRSAQETAARGRAWHHHDVTDEVLARRGEAIATVRAFAEHSGAERVVLLVGGEGETAMVECDPAGAVTITEAGRTWELPADAPAPARARPLPEVRPAPASALWLDPDTGRLEAPLGVIVSLARAVLGLAAAFGGLSVASVDFATRDPAAPLTIAAREGEPLVVATGDMRFTLPLEDVGG
jgi:hypothetical protein